MKRLTAAVLVVLVALLFVGASEGPTDWPQWRGPNQNGVGYASNLPTTWSATDNVVWKTELPAWSAGTPIIWGGRIFITSPSKSDVQPASEPEPQEQQQRGRRGRRGRRRDPGGSKLTTAS